MADGDSCGKDPKTGACEYNFWRYNTPTNNALVDSTNPAAMAQTTEHWFEGYGKYGVRAVWMDEAEPDHAKMISGGQWRLHAGTDTEVIPAWVKYWSKGFAERFIDVHPDGEFFILSRNAWAGTSAHGTALWSGDIGSNWGELETAVTVGQGVGMTGVPLWTTDIGGYSGGNPESASFQQMVVRWFQFGAFCPLFRLHGHRSIAHAVPQVNQCGPTNGDNEVWNLAKQPDHYAAIEKVMMLREDLRNYVKQINNESVMFGTPMMRAVALQFPADPVVKANVSSTEAEFLLGPDWLIAPVTAENATSWPIYLPVLPEGDDKASWIYWWNQTSYKGAALPLPCVSAAIVARTPPLPCVPAAIVAKTPPLPWVSAVIVAKTPPLPWVSAVIGTKGGQHLIVDTTAIGDFPLFYRRPK